MGDLILFYQPGMIFKVACCPTVVLVNLRKYPKLSKVTIFPFLYGVTVLKQFSQVKHFHVRNMRDI